MSSNSRFLKPILFIFCVLLLTQCMTLPTGSSRLHANQKLATPYTLPASAYIALASNQHGDEKQSLLIMAAGREIYDGQWQQGLSILTQLGPVPVMLANEKNVLLAKIALIREQPRVAITTLSRVQSVNNMSNYYQVQFHEILAYSYQAIGNTPESVIERMKLENLLPEEALKENNRRALWLALTTLPIAELNSLAVEATDGSVVKGWMQIALISRKSYANPDVMISSIIQWQSQYPHHPANYILPSSLENARQKLHASPKKIALLLPITGPLAGPGNAIKDGFMDAYDGSGAAEFTQVQIYDTNAVDVSSLYKQAVATGADYVVGPLSKADVSIVASMPHPVPTVLLNDFDGYVKDNAYKFGLSPSSEARQVAARARKHGLNRVLIIAPAGAWGNDVVSAFSRQWSAGGGSIVETLQYAPQDDLNVRVHDFLHVTDSDDNNKKIQPGFGRQIDLAPKRRQDFDVVFLVAYPTTARQIMPLLKYYYAGDIPVYATSSVYAGSANSRKDRDLDRIIFCDMPWVFSNQMGSRNWPEQFNSYNRLYALGLDSYALSNQLNQLILFPALGVSDKSGVLYLSSNQQIARILAFGKFNQGLAQLDFV